MKNIDRPDLVTPDRKAAAVRKIWLREREEKRTIQITANADIRRRWIESIPPESEVRSAAERRKKTDYDSRNSSS